MKKRMTWIALGMGVAVAGCLPSVNPLYTEKDLSYDAALVGLWSENEDADESWTFEKKDDTSYRLVIRNGEKTSPFVAHLVKLGDHRFLDVCPDGSGLDDLKCEDTYKATLIPGHLFFKVVEIEPVLRMGMLNPDWLEKLLKQEPQAIRHRESDDEGLVLTASTQELQAFVLKHVNTEGAWGDDLSEMKHVAAKAESK